MGKLERYDIERLSRHLNVKIVEAALANFAGKGRNNHTYNRLFLVISESGGDNYIHNHSCNEHFPMQSSHIYFIPGNTDLEYSFCFDMTFVSFHFNLELFNNYDIFSLQKNFMAISKHDFNLNRIAAYIRGGPELNALCFLEGTVMCIASEFIQSGAGKFERLDFITRKYGPLFEYIREKADASTTVEALAEVAGITRDTLSREFSRDCGITLKQYLTRELILRAENLLLAPKTSARSVAEKLNFNDEYYFSRFFKKNTGHTPGQYRASRM